MRSNNDLDTPTTYTILWGHSGTAGQEWTTAREASRYAPCVWGVVDAASPQEAVAHVAAAHAEPSDWWHDARTHEIHCVWEG